MKIEKLFPVCKDYLWGGMKLPQKYGKQTEASPCAESWELSFHPDGPSRLASGKTLAEATSAAELGARCGAFPFFPTLIKFIDAKDNLSVQVHPSDDYALANEHSLGKTEMWYIVEAEPGAGIYLGFNRDVSREEFEAAIRENRLTELLNFYPVQAGDCYFIPSGTIHAIGKGCLICEIQQNSNITYRVYDYGRKDKNGNERELHVEKAIAVTNLKKHTPRALPGLLGASKYFTVVKLDIAGAHTYVGKAESFTCLSCVGGSGTVDGMPICAGDSFFVPAGAREVALTGTLSLLCTTIEQYMIRLAEDDTTRTAALVRENGDVLLSRTAPRTVSDDTLIDGLLGETYLTRSDIAEVVK